MMDGFTSSLVRARNAPATSFKVVLDKHVKPDGWWQSVTVGVSGMWFAAWAAFGLISLLCEMLLDPFCSWGTQLTLLLLNEDCLVKHYRTSLEMKTCLVLLPALPLTHLEMKIIILPLRCCSQGCCSIFAL